MKATTMKLVLDFIGVTAYDADSVDTSVTKTHAEDVELAIIMNTKSARRHASRIKNEQTPASRIRGYKESVMTCAIAEYRQGYTGVIGENP